MFIYGMNIASVNRMVASLIYDACCLCFCLCGFVYVCGVGYLEKNLWERRELKKKN